MAKIYPTFRYRDCRAAIAWLEQAFGFEPVAVHDGEDGTVAHAELRLGGHMIMVGTEPDEPDPRWGPRAGREWVYVGIEDVDGLFERATGAGAEVVMPLTDQEHGSRDFSVRDPDGNVWSFGTYAP